MKKYIVFFFLIIISVYCDKKATDGDEKPFKGITKTDNKGRVLSIDPEDWDYDNYLNVKYDTIDTKIIPEDNVVFPPYPNPAYEYLYFKLGLSDYYNVSGEIYSTKGDLVKDFSFKEASPPGIQILFWDLRGNNGNKLKSGLYRTIIKYFKSQKEIYICFGDIQIY